MFAITGTFLLSGSAPACLVTRPLPDLRQQMFFQVRRGGEWPEADTSFQRPDGPTPWFRAFPWCSLGGRRWFWRLTFSSGQPLISQKIFRLFVVLQEFINDFFVDGHRFSPPLLEVELAYNHLHSLSCTPSIKNGFGKWYMYLLYPRMEPTNNLGEQAIREHVIMRKIIGCFRSESGAENYQFIASFLASWKLQKRNIFEDLADLLRKELCLS